MARPVSACALEDLNDFINHPQVSLRTDAGNGEVKRPPKRLTLLRSTESALGHVWMVAVVFTGSSAEHCSEDRTGDAPRPRTNQTVHPATPIGLCRRAVSIANAMAAARGTNTVKYRRRPAAP
jgi:hypothetical protein